MKYNIDHESMTNQNATQKSFVSTESIMRKLTREEAKDENCQVRHKNWF